MAALHFSSRALLLAWLAAAGGCAAVSGLDNFDFDGGAGGSTSSMSSGNGNGSGTGTGGGGAGGDGGSGGARCTVPADCPAATTCHRATCSQGKCGEQAVADETTCEHGGGRVCHDGQCVECIAVSDCPDPGNDCLVNKCRNDACETSKKMDGSPCGNGLACMNGVCSGCSSPSDCGADTFCNSFACTNAACVPMNQPNGTITNMQNTGDCQVNECMNGVSQSVPDDMDTPPDDGNPCTVPCMNGVANAPATAGVACPTGVCDGMGNCVQCINDSECSMLLTCGGGGMPNVCGCPSCQLGSTCSAGTTCLSGFCANSVCCNTACTGTCMACNVAGMVGTCSDIPQLTQEVGVCDEDHGHCGEDPPEKCACDGMGRCRAENGQECFGNMDCASGNCNMMNFECQ